MCQLFEIFTIHANYSSIFQCSQQCGEGYKTRTVYCSDQNIIPVNDSNCANLTKPSSQQPCHEVTGCFSAWITSPWGPVNDDACNNVVVSIVF